MYHTKKTFKSSAHVEVKNHRNKTVAKASNLDCKKLVHMLKIYKYSIMKTGQRCLC